MSKRRKSVTIDENLADEVDRRSEINFSGLVNDLIENYLSEGDNPHKVKAALTVRLDRIESEIERKEKQLNQLREEREEIENLIEEQEEKRDPQLEKGLKVLQNLPEEKLHTENKAVKNWARKIGIPAENLVEKVEEYDSSDESR
ncbi:hypothetical protein AArcSl_0641 [Halalkaliarchaeum desulfuricum]|uniref:Uncharacterized protein n=1 Tax=Halalkaliarchaeum desulfuricum TaxID=2055893 RepID=A0A343TGR9_9EURY|nr:hypothetical protein [Halalkaliarchaeum desulfuricum]AUX08291.1 hypothetical protein AArcSl_0641 [Halalkaliarchaeum desulfuricum]